MGVAAFTIMRTPEQLALPGRSVVLTFDDGPNGDVTAKLLDVLRERGVKAAFCPVGRQVIEQPELVRRMDREGHLIVNHTDSHGPMWLVSRSVLVEQMDQSDRAVGEALGRPDWKSRFFRPPWGFITPGLGKVLRERGMGLMPITYYAGDAAAGPSGARRVIEKTLRNARRNGGGVYVLHDGRHRLLPWPRFMAGWHRSGYNRSWVPGAAAEIIDTLRGEGFTILGAPEFFDSKNR